MREAKDITVIINQKPYHFDQTILTPDEIRATAGVPADYEVWLIVKSPDPEGQLPVDDEPVQGPIDIKSGMRFNVVPPGTFGRC